MTVDEWIKKSVADLGSGSGTPRLDAEVLLCHVLKKDRAWILAHPEQKLTTEQVDELEKLLKRRRNHKPIAYILGKCEFYAREFLVNENVLVPRHESETMIDLLKQTDPQIIIDVGTGSGALAITAKLELPAADVVAVDIDPKCLSVARKNAKIHKAEIRFLKNDLLPGLAIDKPLVILANLPYVPSGHLINEAAKHEPKLALFGGNDGLDLYLRLFDQLKGKTATVFTESLVFQHPTLKEIAKKAGFEQIDGQDLIQVFRDRYTATPKRVSRPR